VAPSGSALSKVGQHPAKYVLNLRFHVIDRLKNTSPDRLADLIIETYFAGK
jgi:hypothetical protein